MEYKSMKISTKFQLITLLFVSLQSFAKSNLNWQDLSQEQYIDNLVECKTTLDELKWSHNLWPKENKTEKPKFADVMDSEKIRQSVLNNLKMQVLLQEEFGLKISDKTLQDDMYRMANNTQNASGLREMFVALNNDATSVVQCISRSHLVNKIISEKYYNNQELHKLTRSIAKTELESFQQSNTTDNLSVHYRVIEFTLNSTNNQKPHQRVIKLNPVEFSQKLSELNDPQLKQERNSFTFSQILNQTKDTIEVEVLTWSKQKLSTWLKSKSVSYINLVLPEKNTFYLPEIAKNTKPFDAKAGTITGDTWKRPYGIKQHTAIWTGTEMIIWGGYDGSVLNTGYKYVPSQDTWTVISTVNAPDARSSHIALWTGTDMIVWGGRGDNTSSLNTGGIYNVFADNWMPTSMISVPPARDDFTAVWTGTEMLIWGGGNLNSGAFFSPGTNSWGGPINANGAPVGRGHHSAIWADDKMIIWGGIGGSAILGDGGIYDPSAGWSTVSSIGAALPRYDHTAVWGNNEMIIWGGLDSNGLVTTSKKYNPQSGTWSTIQSTNAPTGSIDHTAVWADSKMVTWGGEDNTGYRNTGGAYDPVLDTWAIVNPNDAPTNRKFHTAVWTGIQMIIWGGEGSDGNYLNTGGKYAVNGCGGCLAARGGSLDYWRPTSIPNTPQNHFLHTAIWTGSEMIVWSIGHGDSYNPLTDSWIDIQATGSPYLIGYHSTVWTGTEMIVWGGGYDSPSNIGGRYNPLSDSWIDTTLTNAPTARILHTSVWSGTEMIVWGGDNGSSNLNTGSRYNPQLDTWQATQGIGVPSARDSHTAIWGDGQMLVWGGNDNSGTTNTGNIYNPQTDSWLPIDSTFAPTARKFHTAVWTGDEMIIFGGEGQGSPNNSLSSGSRYDPAFDNWVALPSSTLTPRASHTAIWTGQDMIVWGGVNRTSQTEPEGYKYNLQNDTWQPIQTVFEPIMRVGHTAIWTGTEMIVWGGSRSMSGPVSTRSGVNSTKIDSTMQGFGGGGGGFGSLSSIGIYYPYSYYEISGTLNNLSGDQVVLQNNLGDDLILTNDGNFTFPSTIIEGSDYAITVLTNPSNPNQICTVTNASGTIITSSVSDIAVNCVTNQYTIGGTVTGMHSGSPNTMILQNNNGDDLTVNSDGSFVFSTLLDDASAYNVTILSQPDSPIQSCSVVNGSSNVVGADVLNVQITCLYWTDLIFKHGFE